MSTDIQALAKDGGYVIAAGAFIETGAQTIQDPSLSTIVYTLGGLLIAVGAYLIAKAHA